VSNVTKAELHAGLHLTKSHIVRSVCITWIEGDHNRIGPAVSYVQTGNQARTRLGMRFPKGLEDAPNIVRWIESRGVV